MAFKCEANTEIKQSTKLKKKAIRMISFKERTKSINPLFKKLTIMKMKNILIYTTAFSFMIK